MNKYLLLFLLLVPQIMFSQEPVKPVISNDYLLLIKGDSLNKAQTAKADSLQSWQLKMQYFSRLPVAGVKFGKRLFAIEPLVKKYIEFGGTFTSAFALKSINNTPALQNTFAQGRSSGGAPRWQGPETGEMFSYGPSLSDLEYNGAAYAYDINGRLVNRGAGNGLASNTYDNGIFRNGFLQNQSLSVRISKGPNYGYKRWSINLKAGTGNEGMVIRDNRNSFKNLAANFDATMNKLNITGGYSGVHSRFSNENRGGFLNRIYQNSLLTPVTFDNSYGDLLLAGVQRRYGSNSDNPGFLLADKGHFSKNSQQTGNVSAKLKMQTLTLGASSTLEANALRSDESLKEGTAFFNSGFPLARQKNDHQFTFDGYADLSINYGGGEFKSTAKMGYTRTEAKTDIGYQPQNSTYRYKRSVDEFLGAYHTVFDANNVTAALNVGNKTYHSSTLTKSANFLPSINGFVRINPYVGNSARPIKIVGAYNQFYTEPSTATSYAYYASTQLTPENAFKFFPVTEVSGFTGLQAVKNAEFTSRIEMFDNNLFQITGSYFVRKTQDEIFPVAEGEKIVLKNLADVRFNGFEMELTQRTRWSQRFRIGNTLSFYKWTNKVKRIAPGYANTPIAGFSTVNKALVEGQPVGVLVGNSYMKDQNGNTLIGNDGYPNANASPSVIGNPIPDFTMKLSQDLSLKQWSATIDWEYKKGGDIWNGTRALLDYYGRSEGSAKQRNTTGYVFEGVNAGGQVNTTPVNFYNPNRPLSEAKWLRYGPSGVATDYIEKGDAIRLRNIALTYTLQVKKTAQRVRFTAYAKNIIIWTPYQGADPDQLMYDQANAQGLDFFNLPSTKTFGVNVSVQF